MNNYIEYYCYFLVYSSKELCIANFIICIGISFLLFCLILSTFKYFSTGNY